MALVFREQSSTRIILVLPILLLLVIPSWSFAESELCFEEAGQTHNVPPKLLESISTVENKSLNPTAINWNKNKTYDFGIMQINSTWYRTLGKDLWSKLGDPCTNIHVGAWILSQCIQKHGLNWKAVGCYNSSLPDKQASYSQKVYKVLVKGTNENGNKN